LTQRVLNDFRHHRCRRPSIDRNAGMSGLRKRSLYADV